MLLIDAYSSFPERGSSSRVALDFCPDSKAMRAEKEPIALNDVACSSANVITVLDFNVRRHYDLLDLETQTSSFDLIDDLLIQNERVGNLIALHGLNLMSLVIIPHHGLGSRNRVPKGGNLA